MFRSHRTDPRREFASVATSFHERLAGPSATTRPDPPRISPQDLRGRLGRSSEIGLRHRIDRRLRTA